LRETSGDLYPVPVRVTNYRLDGNSVNKISDPWDFTSSQLFRRFFTFDLTSGISGGSLKVIRVPVSMDFMYHLFLFKIIVLEFDIPVMI
jgi:hypothetical protein